ncbi:terminase small subunit [Bacillus infantis]|uniref:terminase small subunit n=1 Tax=Bacillus infantis TaxID=324767 RepID=UPI0020066445|nr:terminase small subunit [Bacillus infantis]MCK6203938.1 terminase small subunit [Bacillus infantis]
MALRDKQERFAQEYIIDLNATQAAIRAGYSAKTANEQGSRLLANVKVRARIEELQSDRAEKLELDAEWVLKRLMQISDRCMTTEPVMEFDYESKQLVETGEYKFDSTGANKATELIGKHLGMFKDKLELTGDLEINVSIDDD